MFTVQIEALAGVWSDTANKGNDLEVAIQVAKEYEEGGPMCPAFRARVIDEQENVVWPEKI